VLRIGRAVIRVTDLERAAAFYARAFGFSVLFDREIFPGFRSLHVGPAQVSEPGIWLFPAQTATSDDEPILVLYSNEIDADLERARSAGAQLARPLSGDSGARSASIRDPFGNVIVLTEI